VSQKGRVSLSQSIALEQDRISRSRAQVARFQNEISAYAAKQREKQGRKNAKPDYNGPTPERIAKTETERVYEIPPPIGTGGERTLTRAYEVRAPIDVYKAAIPDELLAAGTRLIADFLISEAGPRMTGNYTGVPGGVAGPRHGGVADHIREAQSTVTLIRAEWGRDFLTVVDWVITGAVRQQDGSSLRLADLGRRISPWTSRERDQSIGYGMFYMTLALAARFYARQRALGRLRQPPSPQEVAALLTEGRARLQRYREHMGRQQEREAKSRLISRR